MHNSNRWILILAVLMAAWQLSWAQEAFPVAKLKLRDGTIIKDAMLKCTGENRFTIPLADSTGMIIYRSEIKYIRFSEPATARRHVTPDTSHYHNAQEDWYHEILTGVAFGFERNNFTIGHIHGYRLNKHFTSGIGLNYDRYAKIAVLPLYADFRYYFKTKKLSSYYFGNLGYGFGTNTYNLPGNADLRYKEGGIMWQTGLGLQINFSGSALAFRIGYKQQNTEIAYDVSSPWNPEFPEAFTEKINYRSVVFTTSIMF